MEVDQLKRKLRELKRLEEHIRFEGASVLPYKERVWNSFFCTNSYNNLIVRYPLWKLVKLDKQELKEVFQEYFYFVYFQKYKESGMNFEDIYDPEILSVLGLSPGASTEDLKKRFRELAKKHHPDHGGDSSKMVDLLEVYHKLVKKE